MKFNFLIPKTAQSHLRTKIKIPQKPTKELARVFGDLLGDGNLQLDRGLVSFYSKDLREIKKEQQRFKKLFGISGIVYEMRPGWKSHKLSFPSKTLAEFFYHIGFPDGNRTDQTFLITKWIFQGSSEIKSSFLSGFFDAEGSICPDRSSKRPRWRISLKQHKREDLKLNGIIFMNQLKYLLNFFGIKSTNVGVQKGKTRKTGVKTICVYLQIERSLFEFHKFVGFENFHKQKRLKNALKERETYINPL